MNKICEYPKCGRKLRINRNTPRNLCEEHDELADFIYSQTEKCEGDCCKADY